MKFLYIVDYWVPFPLSEYGGLVILIASSDTEAFNILSSSFNDLYTDRIMERIVNSQKFELVGHHESRIIESFTT